MSKFGKKSRSLRYRLWLGMCWAKNVLGPNLGASVDPVMKFSRYVVGVTIVAFPMTIYLITAQDTISAVNEMPALSLAQSAESISKPATQRETALEHGAKHANPSYVCPMHSDIIDKNPDATCPICGMNLVEVKAAGENGMIELSSVVMNSLGVRTGKVKRKTLYRRVDSVGYISPDENKIITVNLRTDGWIERLVVKTVGERVKKGQLILEVYSPKLVNAQEEYLQATIY